MADERDDNMIEILIAFILIWSIAMSGFRRMKLLNLGFAVQSFVIACICLILGYQSKEYHYFILFLLTLVTKVIVIPYIINRSTKNLRLNRETQLIISGYWSYVLAGIFIASTFILLKDFSNLLFKAGCVLLIVGVILLIGRKKAITQMIGLLTMENGIVLFEIAMVKLDFIIEFSIVFEMLILALIMGVMIVKINNTFDSINTDNLSNLKE